MLTGHRKPKVNLVMLTGHRKPKVNLFCQSIKPGVFQTKN